MRTKNIILERERKTILNRNKEYVKLKKQLKIIQEKIKIIEDGISVT